MYITTNVRKRWVNISDPQAGNETRAERRHHRARRWSFLAPISRYERTRLALRQARQCSFLIKSFTESTPSRHQCFLVLLHLPFSLHTSLLLTLPTHSHLLFVNHLRVITNDKPLPVGPFLLDQPRNTTFDSNIIPFPFPHVTEGHTAQHDTHPDHQSGRGRARR